MSSRVSTIYSRIVSEKMVSTNTSKISELNCFQLVNSESVPYPYSYVYTTILIVILLYAIPVNIILIVGTCKTPAKFTTSQKLFLLQSVSDLLTTLITMPVIIYVINFGQKITLFYTLDKWLYYIYYEFDKIYCIVYKGTKKLIK